jgi:hypothetical protein
MEAGAAVVRVQTGIRGFFAVPALPRDASAAPAAPQRPAVRPAPPNPHRPAARPAKLRRETDIDLGDTGKTKKMHAVLRANIYGTRACLPQMESPTVPAPDTLQISIP